MHSPTPPLPHQHDSVPLGIWHVLSATAVSLQISLSLPASVQPCRALQTHRWASKMSQPHQTPDTHPCCFIAHWVQSQTTTELISGAGGQQKSAFAGEREGSNGFGTHQGYQRSSSVGHRHKCNNQRDKKPCKKAQGVSSVEKKKKKEKR